MKKSVAFLHIVVVKCSRAMTSDFDKLNSVKGNIMIKKILPAMIGAALVGGMANATADVTAMGHIDTAILLEDTNTSGVDSTTNLVCTTCSFGFKGSEDLGNGLSAIFKIDFQYDTTFTPVPDTDPAELHATILDSPRTTDSEGELVVAIYEFVDGKLLQDR